MYDLIGDIHGHADELVQLLETLGYQKTRGIYQHQERKVIFLGDFIDRGPKIRQVLEIVRPMVEEREALAVMGNHELNALAFHTEDSRHAGTFLRKRTTKNIRQHAQTILQLGDKELTSMLDWFRTLPLWLDLDGLRAVHACWDERAVAIVTKGLEEHGGLNQAFVQSACKRDNGLFDRVEILLKGKEIKLPAGVSFKDKEGYSRTDVRTRWYESPVGQTYGTYALATETIDCDVPIEPSIVEKAQPYPVAAKPVFVGHYWLWANRPEILTENVACLDFSVAKGGLLCAYRWQHEQKLTNDNFVWVGGTK